ncbi:hypothetical protein [Nocardiopsis sp. NPDC057823]|uniref:hypothetical protein n=1 Tax=Nocardiopsis sp. NPDC057823 TaxID=3346256 RepID=UPI00366EB53D
MAVSKLQQALASGDRATQLAGLRDHLARQLQKASPKEAPALSRELRIITDELDRLGAGVSGDSVDDLAARRARRRAAPPPVDGAAEDQ